MSEAAAPKRAPQTAQVVADDPEGLAAEALLHLGKGRPLDAEKAIKAAIDRNRKEPRFYSILGRIWSAQGRRDEATESFRHAARQEPRNALWHAQVAESLLKGAKLREAEEEIRLAIGLKPRISSFHSCLGAVLLEQCFFQQSHSSLRRAIRLDRKNIQARVVLGRLLAAKGDYRGAEKTLKRAHRIDPSSLAPLSTLSSLFEQQGKTDEAVDCVRKAFDGEPHNVRMHIRISNLYRKSGRLDEAEMWVRKALSIEPTAAGHYCLSGILSSQVRMEEALHAIEQASALDPENQVYQARLAQLRTTKRQAAEPRPTPNAGAMSPGPNMASKPGSGFSARMGALWRKTTRRRKS